MADPQGEPGILRVEPAKQLAHVARFDLDRLDTADQAA
jgi:hypothetical protein